MTSTLSRSAFSPQYAGSSRQVINESLPTPEVAQGAPTASAPTAAGAAGPVNPVAEPPARPINADNLRHLASVHDEDGVSSVRRITVGNTIYGVQRHLDQTRTPVRYVRAPNGKVWMVNRHADVFRVVEKDPTAKRRTGVMLHAREEDDPAGLIEAARIDGLMLCDGC